MKNEQIIICILSLYLIYILFFRKTEEFDLPPGIITDKTLLDPSKDYEIGVLKDGIVSTVSEAVSGGKTCDSLPQFIYRASEVKKATPKDAVCTPQVLDNYIFTGTISGSSINPRFFRLVDLNISDTVPTLSSWVSYNSSGVVYVSSGELLPAFRPAYAIFSRGVFTPTWNLMSNFADRVAVSSGNFSLAATNQRGAVLTANGLSPASPAIYSNSIAPVNVGWIDNTSTTLPTTTIDVGHFPLSLTAGGNTSSQQPFCVLVQSNNRHLITFGSNQTQWTGITNLPSPSVVLKTPITDISVDGTIVSVYYTVGEGSTPSKTQIFYADFSITYTVRGAEASSVVGPFTQANLSWREVMLPYALKTAYISSEFRGFGIKEDGTLVACRDVRVAKDSVEAASMWFVVPLITPGLRFNRVCYRKNDLDMVLAVTNGDQLYADFNASNIFV